jgi:hypothetical protein
VELLRAASPAGHCAIPDTMKSGPGWTAHSPEQTYRCYFPVLTGLATPTPRRAWPIRPQGGRRGGIAIPSPAGRSVAGRVPRNLGGDERDRTADLLVANEALSRTELHPHDADQYTTGRSRCRASVAMRGPIPSPRQVNAKTTDPSSRPRDGMSLAERQGFEPWEPKRVQRFSRPPLSTTQAPLRTSSLWNDPGGEGGIRTLGATRTHTISSRADSTALAPLRGTGGEYSIYAGSRQQNGV